MNAKSVTRAVGGQAVRLVGAGEHEGLACERRGPIEFSGAQVDGDSHVPNSARPRHRLPVKDNPRLSAKRVRLVHQSRASARRA